MKTYTFFLKGEEPLRVTATSLSEAQSKVPVRFRYNLLTITK